LTFRYLDLGFPSFLYRLSPSSTKKKKKRRKEKSKQTLACTTFTFRLVILSINRSSSSKEVTGVFIFDYHHQFTDLSVHLKNLTKNNKSFP